MVGSPGVEPDSLVLQASAMTALAHFPMVVREGLEPPTPASSGLRSTIGATSPRHTHLLAACAAGKQVESE